MAGYTLHLNNSPVKQHANTYKRKELEEMTTYQLRDICTKETIIKGITDPLNRYELIETILRYRGEKEALFIRKYKEGGWERITELLQHKKGTLLKDEGTIHNPARLILYNDLDLTLYDRYQVGIDRSKKDDISKIVINRLVESNVFLVDDEGNICTILNLVSDGKEPESYFLERDGSQPINLSNHKFYHLMFFEKKESDILYNCYYDLEKKPQCIINYYLIPLADLEIRDVEDTEAILSIDFGTSNTTAGSFLDYGYISRHDGNDILNKGIEIDNVNIVKFLSDNNGEKKWMSMIPTLVCVADCSDEKDIVYHFGYEAQKDTRIKYFDESFSMFYEMKRWVNSYTQMQEIIDKQGHCQQVSRGSIIRQYLLYIIKCAQRQFKCRFHHLHLTSPVKQKHQFNKMFKDLMPEYEIDTMHMLDEGTAVIYNSISNMIKKNSFEEGALYSALIIDCGGGTTDLCSSEFKIRSDKVDYKVDIVTTYENGETNFGGDNITYRIMQFIKIMFARFYGNQEPVSIDELIDVAREDIFRYVDEFGVDAVYEKLNAAYDAAEEIIPTKFKNYENRTRDEYYMVKNNFYFLFDIADKMKKKFYITEGIVRNRFQASNDKEQEDLRVTIIDRWNLVVRKQGQLVYNHNFPDVVFNIKEIELLLKADIYNVVNKFLEEFYNKRTLDNYSVIKLTGQSCRIDIFREALKEFVPGKSIEFKQQTKEKADISELKLTCLKGAIQYVNANKMGITDVELHHAMPSIPYSVSGKTHENKEVMLIYSLNRDQTYGYLSRNENISLLELDLKDGDGRLKHHYAYHNEISAYKAITYEELIKKYNRYSDCIPQHAVDEITDHEVKFFVFAAQNQWGFYLVPLMRKESQLYLGRDEFFPFENEDWAMSFFDGTK